MDGSVRGWSSFGGWRPGIFFGLFFFWLFLWKTCEPILHRTWYMKKAVVKFGEFHTFLFEAWRPSLRFFVATQIKQKKLILKNIYIYIYMMPWSNFSFSIMIICFVNAVLFLINSSLFHVISINSFHTPRPYFMTYDPPKDDSTTPPPNVGYISFQFIVS